MWLRWRCGEETASRSGGRGTGLYLVGVSPRILRPLGLVLFLGAITMLSLADRAPRLVRVLWASIRRVGSAAERMIGFDVVDRSDIPLAMDTIGHVGLWGIAGVLSCLTFSRRTSLVFLILSLIVLSAGVEVGQGLLSSSRRPEVRDLVANTIGITAGVLAAAAMLAMIGVFGRISSNLSR